MLKVIKTAGQSEQWHRALGRWYLWNLLPLFAFPGCFFSLFQSPVFTRIHRNLVFATWGWCWNAALLAMQRAAPARKGFFGPVLVTITFGYWDSSLVFSVIQAHAKHCCKHTLSWTADRSPCWDCGGMWWPFQGGLVSAGDASLPQEISCVASIFGKVVFCYFLNLPLVRLSFL